jgi:hypothetical protein
MGTVGGQRLSFTNRNRVWAAGVFDFDRADLERAVKEGRQLDITVIGLVHFADDITPDLARRAIGRFKHRGMLRASPAVARVLEQKEAATRAG